MLILSRGIDQGILIGDNVRIVIREVRRGAVKVGIEAPRSVRIFRDELLLRGENFDEVPLPRLMCVGTVA